MALVDTAGVLGDFGQNQLYPDDECPDYEAVVSRSNSNTTSSAYDFVEPLNISRTPSKDAKYKRYMYTYNMLIHTVPLQFFISVEPYSGQPDPGKYQFRLSMKANGVERPIGEPIARQLTTDPRNLEFVVFVFPGKQGVPANCLWSLRVWLRKDGVDHRLFGEDDLWIGKDPDFNLIRDASFARQDTNIAESGFQRYRGYIGNALVTFTVRYHRVRDRLYKYSLEYEGGGVGDILFDNFRVRLDADPRLMHFLIYTVPTQSMPPGATHRLRVWLRSRAALHDPTLSTPLAFNDSWIYQRVFKMDDFKIGGRLDFASLGTKLIMAFPAPDGPTVVGMTRCPVNGLDRSDSNGTDASAAGSIAKVKERDRDREKGKEKGRVGVNGSVRSGTTTSMSTNETNGQYGYGYSQVQEAEQFAYRNQSPPPVQGAYTNQVAIPRQQWQQHNHSSSRTLQPLRIMGARERMPSNVERSKFRKDII